jgi:hypothetical protein
MASHRMRRAPSAALWLATTTFGFASVADAARGPVLVAPVQLAPGAALLVTPPTAEAAAANHMMRPLDPENTVIYEQQFGNNAAIGALFGPLGVAANIAATKKRTEDETAALSGKVIIDGSRFAREALAAAGYTVAEGGTAAAQVTPTVRITSSGAEPLHVSVWLGVNQSRDDGKAWQGQYGWLIDDDLTRAEVIAGLSEDRRAQLETKVRDAFTQVATLLRDDAAGTLTGERQLFFKAPTWSPRFNYQITGMELPAPEGRLNVRTVNAVVSLPSDRVEIAKVVESKK